MRGMEGLDMEFEYEVDFVLGKLKENRAKHKIDFDKAMKGYRAKRLEMFYEAKKQLIDNIETMQADLEQDDTVDWELDDLTNDVEMDLDKPRQFLEHYDDMIGQLGMTSQKKFTLSRAMYKQLVQDEWEWSRNWKMSNSMYVGG